MQENFDEYMEFFKKQSLLTKQSIIFEQLQLLAGVTNSLCKNLNIDNQIIINRELLDIKASEYTEHDFAEAIITFINSIQNSISDYACGVSNLLEKINEEK